MKRRDKYAELREAERRVKEAEAMAHCCRMTDRPEVREVLQKELRDAREDLEQKRFFWCDSAPRKESSK